MNMRYAQLMMAMAFMLDSTSTSLPHKTKTAITLREIETHNHRRQLSTLARKRKQGLSNFTIDGHTVEARNFENALRKVNNLKSTQSV